MGAGNTRDVDRCAVSDRLQAKVKGSGNEIMVKATVLVMADPAVNSL